MPTGRGQSASKRLSALKLHHSGFELAEIDLKIRGPGEIFGTAQHGFFELKNASWGDTELIKTTKEFATRIIANKSKYRTLLSSIIGDPAALN
jgi:ATP-dependent DNA helicase RecG